MDNKKLILKYLLLNSNNNGNITISNVEIAKICDCTRQTAMRVLNALEDENILKKDKQTISFISKSKTIVEQVLLERRLNYTDREKELLTYMYERYTDRNPNVEYVVITISDIQNNTSTQNTNIINEYTDKFVRDGLIEKIKGNAVKKQGNKYKVKIELSANENTLPVIPQSDFKTLAESIHVLAKSISVMSDNMQKLDNINSQRENLNIDLNNIKKDLQQMTQNLNLYFKIEEDNDLQI